MATWLVLLFVYDSQSFTDYVHRDRSVRGKVPTRQSNLFHVEEN